MFIWHQSERVHIIWAGVWLTLGALVCLTALAINAPHEQVLLVVPIILSLAGPLLTVIGALIKTHPPPANGGGGGGGGTPRKLVVP